MSKIDPEALKNLEEARAAFEAAQSDRMLESLKWSRVNAGKMVEIVEGLLPRDERLALAQYHLVSLIEVLNRVIGQEDVARVGDGGAK